MTEPKKKRGGLAVDAEEALAALTTPAAGADLKEGNSQSNIHIHLRKIPMLFQHDPSEPVGIWLELREDFRGLFARGRLIPEVARGRELFLL